MRVYFTVPEVVEVVKRLGIDKTGDAQRFHTNNVMRRMMKYMPMDSAGVLTKATVIQSDTVIVTETDYAAYVYYGNRMVNSKTGKGPRWIPGVGWRWPARATLVATTEPLNYTKTFNALAGPFWDRRLAEAEGEVIARELENYIRSRP